MVEISNSTWSASENTDAYTSSLETDWIDLGVTWTLEILGTLPMILMWRQI